MKQMFLFAIAFTSCSMAANAQTTGSNSTNGTTYTSEGTQKQKKHNKQATPKRNHRRTYNWETGQRATPTGQEATGIGSGYSAIRKDTSGTRDSSSGQQ